MSAPQVADVLRQTSDRWLPRIPLPGVREGVASLVGSALVAFNGPVPVDVSDGIPDADGNSEVDFQAADDEYLLRWLEKNASEEEMIKLLKGVTHAIVVMSKKEVAEKSGIYGTMFLVFGSDEANAIGQIHLLKLDNRLVWRPPNVTVTIGGQPKSYPVFKGKVADEISEWGEKAYSLIKKTFGKAQFGHKYRIANDQAFDETKNKEANATP